MNIQLATKVVDELSRFGVREFLVCAGARNAPFVKVLGSRPGVMHFFDERAAGFFALGRARISKRPVAVVTTSGTAVAELVPSAIEAFYSGVPIVFVTADRPKKFRGSGAPQAIEQVGIFSHYSRETYDWDKIEDVENVALSEFGPTQINVCFDEPLLMQDETFAPVKGENSHELSVKEFFQQAKRPLVIVGALSSRVRSSVYEYLMHWRAPIYLEASSGLREAEALSPYVLKCGSALLTADNFKMQFDSVVRFGGVPTTRLWRDLDNKLIDVPVLSVGENSFSGLARYKNAALSFNEFFNEKAKCSFDYGQDILATDKLFYENLENLWQEYAHSEPSFIRWLAQTIPPHSSVFLGNSLPIREWDMAAPYLDRKLDVRVNRGANGIDGLIATFLGSASVDRENWLILGDLSALYDLNALAFSHYAANSRLRIVLVNNGGGQIFNRMFHDPNFLNSHQLEFANWAEMFGWGYLRVDARKDIVLPAGPMVIEVHPDAKATDDFWRAYEGLPR